MLNYLKKMMQFSPLSCTLAKKIHTSCTGKGQNMGWLLKRQTRDCPLNEWRGGAEVARPACSAASSADRHPATGLAWVLPSKPEIYQL